MLEEGKVGLQNGTKQQKVVPDTRDKRSQSVASREEQHKSPWLEVDGAPIP